MPNPFPFPMPMPDPMPQSGDGSDTRSTTSKCNEFEFREWVEEQVSCETEAADLLNEVLSSLDFEEEDVRRGLCAQITGKVSEFDCGICIPGIFRLLFCSFLFANALQYSTCTRTRKSLCTSWKLSGCIIFFRNWRDESQP